MKTLAAVLLLAAFAVPAEARYYWYPCPEPGFSHWLYLKGEGGGVIGGYDRKAGVYCRLISKGQWSRPTEPPYPVPAPLKTWGEPARDFGVNAARIGSGYQLNGKAITKERAERLVKDQSLKDDSTKAWLTFVGQHPETVKQVKEWFDGIEHFLIFAEYDPHHWHVDGLFRPGVYLQKADGTVLAKGERLPGRPLLGAVLRDAAGYRDEDAPTFDSYAGWGGLDFSRVSLWAWGGLAVLVVVTLVSATREKP